MDKINEILGRESSKKRNSSYFEKEKRGIDYCEVCNKTFKHLIARKHKCKRCKRYICSNCGQNKTIIIGIDIEKEIPHRTCDLCLLDQHFISEFIKTHKLKWCSSSTLSEKWLKAIPKNEADNLEYSHCLYYFEKNAHEYEYDHEIICKDIDDGRTDYELWNFSMRDFLYALQKDIPREKIKLNIKNVLKAIVIKFPEIGYCQGMNYIIGFLLCFANEEQAFKLFAYLVQSILPCKYFQSNGKGDGLLGVMAEKYALSFFLQDFLEDDKNPENLDLAQQILEIKSANWLLTLAINVLDVKTTFHVWDCMLMDTSFLYIDWTVLAIIVNQLNYLSDSNYDSSLISDSIVRNINVDILKKFSKIMIDNNKKKKIFDEFIKSHAEKWNKKEPFVFRQLERITHFSKDEVKEIQNEFLKIMEEKSKVVEGQQGIQKEDFFQIMKAIQSNSMLQGKAFLKLDENDLGRIFEVFDYNHSGSLDFREFLCCISLLIRGQIKEKIELCFALMDYGNKNYLNAEEIEAFLDMLMKAISLSFQKDHVEFYAARFLEFKKRVIEELTHKERLNFADLSKISKDPFILEISNYYRGLIRKGTSAQVAATINDIFLSNNSNNE